MLRGSVLAQTALSRTSHPQTQPTTPKTPTLHDVLGKAVWAKTSLDTKIWILCLGVLEELVAVELRELHARLQEQWCHSDLANNFTVLNFFLLFHSKLPSPLVITFRSWYTLVTGIII